jgi:hypothetical protein
MLESATASTATAADRLFHEDFIASFSQEKPTRTAHSQAMPRGNRDMYYQHLVGRLSREQPVHG